MNYWHLTLILGVVAAVALIAHIIMTHRRDAIDEPCSDYDPPVRTRVWGDAIEKEHHK